MITIKELITELEKHDPELNVVYWSEHNGDNYWNLNLEADSNGLDLTITSEI